MKICPPAALAESDFQAIFQNALAQRWQTVRSFQCIGNPKRCHLLLYLDGCRITYTDKQGARCEALPGDVVYTPLGSEYRAVLSDFRDADAHTVGINLSLLDSGGAPFALSEGILIFRGAGAATAPLFHRALTVGEGTRLEQRILLLELLELLCRPRQKKIPPLLRPAIDRLISDLAGAPTVAELSEECHISEAYLRRLFRTYLGTSPAAYRNRLRLERARLLLEYGAISVGEISDTLGYASVSHFIKEFRRAYGTSPLRHRRAAQD